MEGYKRSGGFGGDRGGNRGGGRSSFGGGRPSFGGGRPNFRSGGRDSDRKELFDAVCAECNKPCKVPFRPTGDKPVYCSDCFRTKQDSAPRGDYEGRENRNSSQSFPKKDFTPSAPAKSQMDDKKIDDIKKQLESLTTKLDKIIQIVSGEKIVSPAVVKPVEKKADVVSLKTVVNKAISNDKKTTKKVVSKKKPVSKKK